MKESATPFPSTDDLSDDEEAFLRFLRNQLLQQTSYVQVAKDNRYLRDQMKENTGAVRRCCSAICFVIRSTACPPPRRFSVGRRRGHPRRRYPQGS